MKRLSFQIGVTLIAFGCIIVRVSPAAEPSAEENAVRQTAKTFTDAFNKGDAKAIAVLWTPDGEYSIGNDSVSGREEIAKLYGDYLAANPDSKVEIKIGSVTFLAPSVAMERGSASVTGSPNGPPTASDYTAIHVKQGDGRWLMANVSESETPTLLRQNLEELAWLVGDWSAEGDVANVNVVADPVPAAGSFGTSTDDQQTLEYIRAVDGGKRTARHEDRGLSTITRRRGPIRFLGRQSRRTP